MAKAMTSSLISAGSAAAQPREREDPASTLCTQRQSWREGQLNVNQASVIKRGMLLTRTNAATRVRFG